MRSRPHLGVTRTPEPAAVQPGSGACECRAPLERTAGSDTLDGMTTSQVTPSDTERDTQGSEAWKPHTVVVGFDGSPAAARAAGRAAAIVGGNGLLILVAVERAVSSRGILSEPLLEPDDALAAELRGQAQRRLRDGHPRQLTLLRRGDPAEVLMDVAREYDADLVVVGRRGRDFAARVLLGSVATRIVANATCDVLVVS
jgi:nucleotide-binding universal stress UspA family protein